MVMDFKHLDLSDSLLESVKREEEDLLAYFSFATIKVEPAKRLVNFAIRFHNIIAQNFYTTNGGNDNLISVNQPPSFYNNYDLVGSNEFLEDENIKFKLLLFNNSSKYEFYDLTWEITCETISIE